MQKRIAKEFSKTNNKKKEFLSELMVFYNDKS
jgi:hypothetical protein